MTPNVLTKTIIFKQHKRKPGIEETTRCECALEFNRYKHIFVVSDNGLYSICTVRQCPKVSFV